MKDYRTLLYPRTERVVQDAGFLRRAAAFIFDILLLDLIVTAPFTSVFADMIARAESTSITSMTYSTREMGAIILLFAIIYCYFLLFEYLLGQTMGMMLMNVHVEGNESIGRVFLRNLYLIPVFPLIILWIVEPIAIISSKRGVLERVSQTRTVYQKEFIV